MLATLGLGLGYPLVVTVAAHLLVPEKAVGSLVVRDGVVVGSRLVGQPFADPRRFWPRPSATGPRPYVALDRAALAGSSGSNRAQSNPAQVEAVRAAIVALDRADAAVGVVRPDDRRIPVELVTASASGLDPHISVAAARYQAPRVARARGLDEVVVLDLIDAHTRGRRWSSDPVWWMMGAPSVNVLEINLALDELDGPKLR